MAGEVPAFDDLPTIEKLGLRHAWGVFGADDQLGTANFLTPERVLAAAGLVRHGEVHNVVLPLTEFDPPFYGRAPLEHSLFAPDRNSWDDRLDVFYLQGSTHWDGLRHVRAREFGWWGGLTDESQLQSGSGPLGIEHWVEHGLVGRGVLLDVARHYEADEPGYDPHVERSVTAADLAATAERQGVELRPGDILCVRFGWIGKYKSLDADAKAAAASSYSFAGLAADEEMSRWLWNRNVAAIACDNPAAEVSPGDPAVGSLHRRVLPLLGLILGELFDFESVSAACAKDNRYDFLFVAAPLNLPGGVGSPANAVVIR